MIFCDNGMVKIKFPEDLNDIYKFIDYVNTNKITKIGVLAYGQERYSLNFLKEITSPEIVTHVSISGKYKDYEVIYRFINMTDFSTALPEQEFDLSHFRKLKFLSTSQLYPYINLDKSPLEKLVCGDVLGSYKFEAELLNQLTNLKVLVMYRVKDFSFTKIPALTNLRDVRFIQCNVKNFDGIINFKNLKAISADYCRSLKNIKGVGELENLVSIWLCACPYIEDIEELVNVKNVTFFYMESMSKHNFEFVKDIQSKSTLEFLGLSNCGSISSINFIKEMPNLVTLFINDTNVIDGDLTPCLNLKWLCMTNKRHYNLKEEELPTNDGFGQGEYSLWRWTT